MVRHAGLAINDHNTQPWLFVAAKGSIRIYPDAERRYPIVGLDHSQVVASLECATENVVLGTKSAGFVSDVDFVPYSRQVLATLTTSQPKSSATYDAIIKRLITRVTFDPTPLASQDLAALKRAS